jgi:hypothetical protein
MADNIVNSLLNEEIIAGTTEQMVAISVNTATAIAGSFILITFAWSYIKNSLDSFTPGKEGKLFDPMELGRILALCFLITTYSSIAPSILSGIASINRSFKAGSVEYDSFMAKRNAAEEKKTNLLYAKYSEKLNNMTNDEKLSALGNLFKTNKETSISNLDQGSQQTLVEETEKSSFTAAAEYFSSATSFYTNPINLINIILSGLATLISGLVKLIVSVGAFYVLKILVILGPLALAMSILPAFRDQYLTWLQYTLNTAFVFLVINLIDSIAGMNGMYSLISEHISSNVSDGSFTGNMDQSINSSKFTTTMMAFDFMLIALYASAFKITAVFIGKGFAGSIAGKAAGAATVVAGAVAGAAVMGGGMASGGASSAASGAGGSNGGKMVSGIVDGAKSTLGSVDD